MSVESRLLEVVGHTLGTVADIIEGELLGDDGPPAVGAEFNGIRFLYLPHPPSLFLDYPMSLRAKAKQSVPSFTVILAPYRGAG
jgi:hypothetical protein